MKPAWSIHATIAVCTVALIVTMVLCTRSVNDAAWDAALSSRPDGNDEYIRGIYNELGKIEGNTRSIDERLMTPGERLGIVPKYDPKLDATLKQLLGKPETPPDK